MTAEVHQVTKFVRRLSGVKTDDVGNPVMKTFVPRDTWTHHMDFMLGCVGYAVGFGSIWRFPYLVMRNGGGAFLIPYILFMVICGVPLFFMELAIGQYAAASPLSLWDICPLFKGIGWGMLIVSGMVCIYYNIIITWVLYYLVMSFTGMEVPWKTCDNWWNTCQCAHVLGNTTANANYSNCDLAGNQTSPAEEFWKYNALDMTKGMDNMGGIKWQLLVSLICAWVLIFACLCKGVKSVGKVVYFTATSPYVFLFILLIRNCMLEGSYIGILFYVTPRWERLLEFSIWAEAALQVFFSLGPSWGGLITLSSFNKFKNNCYRDAIIIPIINCLTSIFGGFVIFAVIGYMAHISNSRVEDVMEVGPGVTFIAYPEAIAQMPFAPLWAVLFFFMLITIGLDSQFGMFETMTSSFIDEYAAYLRPHKVKFTALMCLVEFLLALPLVTRGGIYMFTIMDWYCGTFSLTMIAFLEIVVIMYIYGVERFRGDIEDMIGHKPGRYWTIMWVGVTPVTLVLIFASSVFFYKTPSYGDYVFPNWALALGWIMGFSSIIPIPLTMIYKIYHEQGTLINRIKRLCEPDERWGATKEAEDEFARQSTLELQEHFITDADQAV